MMPELNGYFLSLAYIALGVAGFTVSGMLEVSMKATGLVLALMGIVHLALKIHGTYLDNLLKQEQLDE